jgi:hypothetical protein
MLSLQAKLNKTHYILTIIPWIKFSIVNFLNYEHKFKSNLLQSTREEAKCTYNAQSRAGVHIFSIIIF